MLQIIAFQKQDLLPTQNINSLRAEFLFVLSTAISSIPKIVPGISQTLK